MSTRTSPPPHVAPVRRAASGSATQPRGDGLVAGYRTIRRAADRHGGRVRTGRSAGSPSESGPTGEGAPGSDREAAPTAVSLVTFDEHVADENAMRLIEMLDMLAGPAIPRIIDVADDESDGPVVVLEFCGESVASLLAAGTEITAGEVVTLVVPILSAVLSLHDRGFAHGDLSVASIAIGAGGRPLLLGVERAVELVGAGRDRERSAADDIRRIADVLADLAPAVRDPSRRRRVDEVAEAIRSGAGAPFSSAFRATAEVRLFEIAEPSPLVLSSAHDHDVRSGERPSPPVVREERRRRARVDEPGQGVVVTVVRLAAAARDRLGAIRVWFGLGSAAPRRRGPLVVGLVIVVGTVLALILVPRGHESRSVDVTGSPAAATSATVGAHPPRADTSSDDTSSDDTSSDDTPSDETPSGAGDASSEDVVAGARAVVDGIAACAVSAADDCWASVIESGTALSGELAASEDPLGSLPDALALPVEAVELRARDDYGDARVVLITPIDGTRPASVLMIRTEAGWRLRDAFDA
ncbi:hypothetical protein ELQ92_10700 [Labedella populi]|uniref:Protein kinase domain-containing protein n=1 Tax=Labedella populi TaxID=2498850 RepID=A0A444QBQ3_9MICO|nr:hypothetical protein [Labedella populi]RWZ61452.1 hypothetical protein ELQ92_10700 [Labedella populi]